MPAGSFVCPELAVSSNFLSLVASVHSKVLSASDVAPHLVCRKSPIDVQCEPQVCNGNIQAWSHGNTVDPIVFWLKLR